MGHIDRRKQVAFTAKLKAGGTAIYIAAADGTGATLASSIDMKETLDRYFLQGKWTTVPKSFLRLGLLEKLHYIAPVDLPTTP
jgi:hypothetical protein